MIRLLRFFLTTFVLFSSLSIGYGQGWQWAQSAGGSGSDINAGNAIAVDATGNSYVLGRLEGTVVFGNTSLTSAGDRDVLLAKFDADGKVLWARRAGGTGLDNGISITLAAGHVYITGSFQRTATFGSITLESGGTAGSSYNLFVAKYDTDGQVVWATKAAGDNAEGTSIAHDSHGNIYVSGTYYGTLVLGNTTLTPRPNALVNSFIAKYGADGTVTWAIRAASNGRIAADAAGNCYMSGYFIGAADFGSFTLTSDSPAAMFLAKYNTDGNILWGRKSDLSGSGQILGIALDATGSNCYITGYFQVRVSFEAAVPTDNKVLEGDTKSDVFLAKYDADGHVIWARKAGGDSFDKGTGIALDPNENVVISGDFEGSTQLGPISLTSRGIEDVFVAAYNADGQPLWAERAGGVATDVVRAVSVDAASNCYLTGFFGRGASFGATVLVKSGSSDLFVAKYSPLAPSVALGSLPAAAFCAGSSAEMPFSSTGSFAAGNRFTVQLSDAHGSFAAPIAIGSGTSSPVTVTIPATVAPGKGYRMRVVSSAPVAVSAENGVDLTIIRMPTVEAGADQVVCQGSPAFELTGFSPAGGSWSGDGVSTAGIFDPSQVAAGAHTLTYTVRSGACVSSASKTVTVSALPTMATAAIPTACGGEQGIGGFAPYTVSFTNSTEGATDYRWEFGDGTTSTEQVPSHTYTESGTYRVSLTAFNGTGCSRSMEVAEVRVGSRRPIPNVITPNGDELNDAFVVEVSCLPLDLQVFSRTGQLVYQQKSYQNNWKGEGLAEGVYFYLLRDSGGVSWKGWVELIR